MIQDQRYENQLEQSIDNLRLGVDRDIVEAWSCVESWHGHDVAAQGEDEPCSDGSGHIAYREHKV